MMMTHPNEDMIDDLLAEARGIAPAPDDALMARVLADAAAQQAMLPPVGQLDQPGLWARAMDAIGGWPALGSLAVATVAGVWIGVAPPASVSDLAAGVVGDPVSVSLLSDGLFLDQGAFDDG